MSIDVRHLEGFQDFQTLWSLQEDLVQQRQRGEIPDTLLFLEHEPVYTIGRTRDQSSLQNIAHLPHPVVEINRGGQGTYHGPGQLVGYAIIDLHHHEKDLHLHLRKLEQALIDTLSQYNVTAQRKDGLTGVWVNDRKIASLGVGVRKWITLHGFAINLTNECLPAFQPITPCGIDGVSMTSLENELNSPVALPDFRERVAEVLVKTFGALS